MNITNLTPKQLRQAADLKERIDALQAEMNAVLDDGEIPIPVAEPQAPMAGRRKGRRRVSTQGRANIAAAARARWAAWRLKKKGAASVQRPSAPPPADKKLHWTQRPGAKARLARAARLGWQKRQA
jgi:hypothetical protein